MEKPGLELWLPQSCSCCHAAAVIYLKEVSNQDLINPGLIQLKLQGYEKKKKNPSILCIFSLVSENWLQTNSYCCTQTLWPCALMSSYSSPMWGKIIWHSGTVHTSPVNFASMKLCSRFYCSVHMQLCFWNTETVLVWNRSLGWGFWPIWVSVVACGYDNRGYFHCLRQNWVRASINIACTAM